MMAIVKFAKKIFDPQFTFIFLLWVVFLLLTFKHCNSEAWLTIYVGLFTGFFTVFVLEGYDKWKLYKSLNHLSGDDWVGWAIKGRLLAQHETENPSVKYNSNATIIYKGDNLLGISVEHKKSGTDDSIRKWNGVIEINRQYLNKGSLTFKYVDDHEVRSCDIIIYKDEESILIYSIPANNTIYKIDQEKNSSIPTYNYGNEVFKRTITT